MGKSTVRGVVAAGLEDVQLKRRIDLPKLRPGDMLERMAPGEWGPDENGLPPYCPVQPLGFDGENYFFVDANGQLFGTGDKAFGRERIAKAFGEHIGYLYWAWPRLKYVKQNEPPLVTGWRPELAQEALFEAASRKGPWRDFEKVRGAGAWANPAGELVLHRGELLFYGSKIHHAGVELDGFFYPRRPKLPMPWPEPAPAGDQDDVAVKLMRFFRTWAWRRPEVDPFLLLGWLGAAMLGGALDWRPSMFFIGDKGTGKSTLQEAVKKLLGSGLISTPDTTAAGIYQRIRNDALPIAVDEIEAEADNKRATAVVKLARLAASGGIMLRGGSDSVGVEFQARSCFLFSAIVPPPMAPQDLSRIAMLTLDKLDIDQAKPTLPDPAEAMPKLLRRLADGWPHFKALYDDYRAALRTGGHDSRGQDTYGTFLACAHMMLGEAGLDQLGYPYEDLTAWGQLLEAAALPERENALANWHACLMHLLTSRVEAWRHGHRSTVGQLLEDLTGPKTDMTPGFDQAQKELGAAGLKLIAPPAGSDTGFVLAIPNHGPLVAAMFRGTAWGGEGATGSWAMSLRQGPADVISTDKTRNKVKLHGQSHRCTLVNLIALTKYGEEQ